MSPAHAHAGIWHAGCEAVQTHEQWHAKGMVDATTPVHKEGLKDTLGIMERPVRQRHLLHRVLRRDDSASQQHPLAHPVLH
jgi:hypothetical protein